MTEATVLPVGGNLVPAAVAALPGALTPALDAPSGLSGPGANFLTGQNGKERMAWTSYAPPGVNLANGSGWSPAHNHAHRDRHLAGAISQALFMEDPTLRAVADTIVTNALGEGLTLTSRVSPELTGMTPEESKAVSHQIETAWARYSNNPNEVDSSGRYTLHEIVESAMLSWILTGEYLCAIDAAPVRGCTYHTKACLLDPRQIAADRTMTAAGGGIYSGVEFDKRGRFTALHLRRVTLGSVFENGEVKRVPVETSWGRKKLAFYFEALFPGQIRGASPLIASLTPSREKNMLNELSVTGQALANAFAMVVESDAPAQSALLGLETHPEPLERAGLAEQLISLREAWYGGENGAKIRADAGQVTHLAIGDHLKFVTGTKQAAEYNAFQKALTRSAARGAGISSVDASGDWGDSNYAASRLEAALPHRLTLRRRRSVAARLYQTIFECWLEEAIAIGTVILPPNAQHFWDCKVGYVQTKWRGAGMVSADRKKDVDAVSLELSNHLLTLEDALAERGADLETTIAQIAAEKKMLEAAGLHPSYFTSTMVRVTTDESVYDDENLDGEDSGNQTPNKGI